MTRAEQTARRFYDERYVSQPFTYCVAHFRARELHQRDVPFVTSLLPVLCWRSVLKTAHAEVMREFEEMVADLMLNYSAGSSYEWVEAAQRVQRRMS